MNDQTEPDQAMERPRAGQALASACVLSALHQAATHPDVRAIDVLAITMTPLIGTSPDFSAPGQPGDAWTDPRTPFGALLALAYDRGHFTPQAIEVLANADTEQERMAFLEDWQRRVIDRFAADFLLWGTHQAARDFPGADAAGKAALNALMDLRISSPDLTPLQVFDLVFEPLRGTSPDFGEAFFACLPVHRLLDRAFPMVRADMLEAMRADPDADPEDVGFTAELFGNEQMDTFMRRYELCPF